MFADRAAAGERLADQLLEAGIKTDIVLGIPRGALPVARPVADVLEVPLDVVVARKIGAPNNPEYALGAVASDGSVWFNDRAIARTGVDEESLETAREEEATNARKKAARYRGGAELSSLAGRRVVVVDDGVATGSTAIACLRQVREAGADRVIFAAPVGPPSSVETLEQEADQVIVLETPPSFSAVGQFYRDFGQVSDEQAMAILEA